MVDFTHFTCEWWLNNRLASEAGSQFAFFVVVKLLPVACALAVHCGAGQCTVVTLQQQA